MTALLLAALVLASPPGETRSSTESPGGVPHTRLAKLTRGINLSDWFSQPADDPESVFLEVMNEPVMTDSARWNVIQKKALAAMRESAPRHTLIATSAEWSEIYRLELVEVVADRNVVYNVHYYDPVRFTHQNAPWVGDWVKGLKNAALPVQPGGRGQGPGRPSRRCGPDAHDQLREGKMELREDRRDYCRGCMWDYATEFGAATGKPGQRVPDADTLKALGLTATQAGKTPS